MMDEPKSDTKPDGQISPRGFGTEVRGQDGSLLKRVTPAAPKPGERFSDRAKTR